MASSNAKYKYPDLSESCILETCLSPGRSDPGETAYAAILPRFTGGLSAFLSLLIIHVIFRSQKRLDTIYHRIMVGLSIANVVGSLAIALTSLPMPREMPREEEFGYH